MLREIILYKTYFTDFYSQLPLAVQDKFDYVLNLVRQEPRVPEKFLKHLTDTDGLFEIRVKSGGNIYRTFCFFDAGRLVVVLTSFQKKTDKTPRTELARAEALKQEYLITKKTR